MEWALITVVFGLIYGSFLNVLILRFDDLASLITKPSHCPTCQARLKWYELVPIFSFLLLRARCRSCLKPISWQYPVVELFSAVLVTLGYQHFILLADQPIWREVAVLAAFLLIIACLMVIFFHDLYEMAIPDLAANWLIALAAIFFLLRGGSPTDLTFGAIVGFLPIALIVYPSRGRWMGEGDVKLSAALGLMLGWPLAAVGLVAAFMIGGLFGLIAISAQLVKPRSAVPFGPFLIVGGLIALFFGSQLLDWYLLSIGYY